MGPTRKLEEDEIQHRRKLTDLADAGQFEKDEAEQQLEKLLFGNEAGFLDALNAPAHTTVRTTERIYNEDSNDLEAGSGDEHMEDVPDEDLFFLDTGSHTLSGDTAKVLDGDSSHSGEDDTAEPTWVDSDDERLTVSLASNTRLRKLRDTEENDVVNGTEYIRRLRRQYERLHPTPEWVKYARKKKKLSKERFESDTGSDSDVSIADQAVLSSTQSIADLLRSAGSLTRELSTTDGGQGRRLRPEVIDIQRLQDVAGHGPSSIDTLQFHSHYPLLLAAGPSSTISLYHVSPQSPNPNPMLTSLHLKKTPLHTVEFCVSPNKLDPQEIHETRIFLSSRRRYFHTWSLSKGAVSKVSRPLYGEMRREQKTMEAFKLSPCGRYMGLIGSVKKGGGAVNVLSTETMQWLCSCRIDSQGGVADFAWWRDGDGFVVIGKNGEASEYSLRERSTLIRWVDQGAVGVTTIALGGSSGRPGLGGDRWVAVGSSSGITNIYDRREWLGRSTDAIDKASFRPSPAKAFDHLTTPISYLTFSHDGQMLVMGSRWKKNALRLVHLPSCTIYKNWPTDKTPLGRISSVALSMNGRYLAVANEQGKIRLWQIRD